jgi:hypothetical protein
MLDGGAHHSLMWAELRMLPLLSCQRRTVS